MGETNRIQKLALSNAKMRFFMLKKLPLAFFAGLRVVTIDKEKASVSLPYKFLNKNPFRSIYFAALSMAAELSTGILAMSVISEKPVAVSMLVLEMHGRFIKKARKKVIFTCNQGLEIEKAIDQCIETGEGRTISVLSKGIDIEGVELAQFTFTWTFKPKSKSHFL